MSVPSPLGADVSLDRLVRLAHDHLGMDVAYVSEFTDGRQILRAFAGDAASFGMQLGAGPELAETYCAGMTRGEIPHVIPDAATNECVSHLAATAAAGIGAYVGVPLYLPDGQLYGTFCGLSHGPEADLNERDAKFLSMLAEFASVELARDRQLRDKHDHLQHVLDSEDLQIALQPVIDLTTGMCTSLEALARFPRTLLGTPDVVFAAAGEVGLRHELEMLAAGKALKMLPKLAPSQCLAVNLSPDVLLTLPPEVVAEQPLERLIVEVTEHSVVEDYTHLRERIRPLRDGGLRLAIDDAGAGYASLRHIIELQPDIIKIDRAIVAGIATDTARRSVVTTFVLLALDIEASIVAEGVETSEELAILSALGVDAAQGYFLGRPSIHQADIASWVRGRPLLRTAGAA